MKLTKRLQTVADFCRDGVRVADVGTDHGYIPVWLSEQGRAERIAASDIREGPLLSARLSARKYGVEDKIEFLLCDGLEGFDRDFDTVVIAGMGGDTIISILSAAPWTKDGVRLVIQPQSKIDRLSGWLCRSGYHIEDAALTEELGKMYLCLLAFGGRGDAEPSRGELHVPRPLFDKRDPLLPKYLGQLEKKLSRALSGMARGGASDTEEYLERKRTLEDIYRMKEEVSLWRR